MKMLVWNKGNNERCLRNIEAELTFTSIAAYDTLSLQIILQSNSPTWDDRDGRVVVRWCGSRENNMRSTSHDLQHRMQDRSHIDFRDVMMAREIVSEEKLVN